MRCLSRHIVLALLLTLLTACTTNVATGRIQVQMLSSEKAIALGQAMRPEVAQSFGGNTASDTLQQYVSGIGRKLSQHSEQPDMPWSFEVLDSDVVNAFALPGGQIFITRGLLSRMRDEAHLAAVLGHEIGHVTARHANDQMTREVILKAGLYTVGTQTDEAWAQQVAAQLGGVTMLHYDRNQELESDRLGVRYLQRAGYDPTAMLDVMAILKAAAGGGGSPEWLSSHPLPDTRIKRLEADLPRSGGQRNAEAYRKQVLDVLPKLPPARHKGMISESKGNP